MTYEQELLEWAAEHKRLGYPKFYTPQEITFRKARKHIQKLLRAGRLTSEQIAALKVLYENPAEMPETGNRVIEQI